MSRSSDIRTVKHLTRQIESGERQTDGWKWERAELLARLCEDSQQKDVAKDCDLTTYVVSIGVRVWKEYGGLARANRPRYAEADYKVAGRGPGFGNSTPAIVEAVRSNPKVATAIAADPGASGAVERAMDRQRPTTPASPGLADLNGSIRDSDRVTGPLGHIHNVLWKEARAMSKVSSLRKAEREDLRDAAGELRMYADLFESWASDVLDSAAFTDRLEAEG